ncbi:unnamed protein product [Schistosoma mattheei]|uniref:Uncharacterized protein n=1 Tax=Schistosoma mattheei TaxID=31246 RepID=A0A3P8HNF5_9TREM|nr:unnamed protein product [Schistosoma mattheei]
MFLIPNLIEENVEYPRSYRYVCFQCLCWNVVWSCSFATLDLPDDHAYLFNCWWANIDQEVHGCCFDVVWVQCGSSIQKFLKVFHPPISLFFNVGDYFALLTFHWSFWFTIISSELLCCIIQFSHVSLSFATQPADIVRSSAYLRLSALLLLFTCLFASV